TEQPVYMGQPVQMEQPVYMGQPVQTEQPVYMGQPVQMEQPVQMGQPGAHQPHANTKKARITITTSFTSVRTANSFESDIS
ncbi:hypothetical protein BDF19DRAFT_429469, partial [Syncephalis fuscata]